VNQQAFTDLRRFGTFCLRRIESVVRLPIQDGHMSWLLLPGIAWTLTALPLAKLLGRLLRRGDRMTSSETDPAISDVAEGPQAPGDRGASGRRQHFLHHPGGHAVRQPRR
jgi:hypothetical protein